MSWLSFLKKSTPDSVLAKLAESERGLLSFPEKLHESFAGESITVRTFLSKHVDEIAPGGINTLLSGQQKLLPHEVYSKIKLSLTRMSKGGNPEAHMTAYTETFTTLLTMKTAIWAEPLTNLGQKKAFTSVMDGLINALADAKKLIEKQEKKDSAAKAALLKKKGPPAKNTGTAKGR